MATPPSGQPAWHAATAAWSSLWRRSAASVGRSWRPAQVGVGWGCQGLGALCCCKGSVVQKSRVPAATDAVSASPHPSPSIDCRCSLLAAAPPACRAAAPTGRRTRYWEGGKGQRDPSKLHPGDPRRYRGKSKTQSAKSKRVGQEGKERRERRERRAAAA